MLEEFTANNIIVVWNPRGLNGPNRGMVLRTLVEDASASIVCLVESKLENVDRYTIVSFLGQSFDGFVALTANNTMRGIIVAWQSSHVQVSRTQVDAFSVTITLSIDGGEPWSLTTVYRPTMDHLRIQFLEELSAVRAAFAGRWAVTWHFNLIMEAADKNNGRLHRHMMGRF